jgi:hypothetical protein
MPRITRITRISLSRSRRGEELFVWGFPAEQIRGAFDSRDYTPYEYFANLTARSTGATWSSDDARISIDKQPA